MAPTRFTPRSAWSDRFREPSFLDLQAGLSEQHQAFLIDARSRIGNLDGVAEAVEWAGIPMRWSFVYRMDGQERAFAYFVPNPDRPMLVLPLNAQDVQAILATRCPKFVSEGIIHAAEVDGVRWAQWFLTSMPQVKELTRLAPRKHSLTVA